MAAVNVTSTATEIVGPGAGPTLVLNLSGGADLYFLFGNETTVTTNNGVLLAQGESIPVDNQMWGITASGTATVRTTAL